MTRDDHGPSFEQRVADAGLSPQQRETSAATLLLAGLVHEQNERLAVQTSLLEEIRDRLGAPVHNTTVVNTTATPSGTDGGEGGGEDVQLREPQTPPADPDDKPDRVPGPKSTASRSTTRRPATKATTSKATPAKKTGGNG